MRAKNQAEESAYDDPKMHNSPSIRYKCSLTFGPFVLDNDNLLRIRDKRVHLFPKQVEALRYLAARSGRVVTKDELISHIWRDAFVTEGSLHQCISAIRRQLGDAAGGLDAIETVSKRGYRFSLPVTVDLPAIEPADASKLRIGILHFEYKGAAGPPDLAERLTIRVAAILSQLRVIGLEVTNEAALNRISPDPVRAAGQLGLSLLVTGQVYQERGARFGAEVEILRASDQTILSSCVAEPDSLGRLPSRLAGCIARLVPLPEFGIEQDEIATAVEGDEECLGLYLKGLAHIRGMYSRPLDVRLEQDLRLAISYFEQATEKDAGHLASLIGLSNCAVFASHRGFFSADETIRTVMNASRAALAIDPDSPGARVAYAMFKWLFDDDQARQGEREIREVLEKRPRHFTATEFLSMGLIRDGRAHEAIGILQEFLDHRPDTPTLRLWLAYALFLDRRFGSAQREAMNCTERYPEWDQAWAYLCFIAAHNNDPRMALEAGNRLSKLTNNGSLLAHEAYGLARCGERERARELVEYILAFHREGTVHSALVPALVALGKSSHALNCLEQAHKQRDAWVPLALIDPRLDPIRSTPRFIRVKSAFAQLNRQPDPGRRQSQPYPSDVSPAKPPGTVASSVGRASWQGSRS